MGLIMCEWKGLGTSLLYGDQDGTLVWMIAQQCQGRDAGQSEYR